MNTLTTTAFARTLPPCEINELREAVLTQGYCVLRAYVPAASIASLRTEIEDCYERFASALGAGGYVAPVGMQSVIRDDRMINNVFHFSKNILEWATCGNHLEVIKTFLNDPFYGLIPKDDPNFILAQLNAREGRVALPFHVDTRMCTPGPSTWSMQCYLSVDATHAGNGGLRVVPGSHLSGVFPDCTKNHPNSLDLELAAGDMVIFSSQLHHATTACAGALMPSWTVLVTYRCWWVKQQYDIAKMVPQTWWSDLSPNQKLMLGDSSQVSADIYGSASSRKGYAVL